MVIVDDLGTSESVVKLTTRAFSHFPPVVPDIDSQKYPWIEVVVQYARSSQIIAFLGLRCGPLPAKSQQAMS